MAKVPAMKCRRHPLDDGIGICSFCLHERLLAVAIAASATTATESSPEQPDHDIDRSSPEPLPLAQSASGHYFTGIRPGASATTDEQRHGDRSDVNGRHRGHGKLSFLSAFLGHSRSDERGGDPTTAKPTRAPSSWFSALINRIRKIKKNNKRLTRLTSAEDAGAAADRRGRRLCGKEQGMTPDRIEPKFSGYETDSAGSFARPEASPKRWTTTPPPPPQQHLGVGLAGFGICLTPFMKTRPAGRQKQLPEVKYSGKMSQPLGRHHCHRRRLPVAPHRRTRG